MIDADGDSSAAREAQGRRAASAPPMIDRGSGFEKMLRGEVKPWVALGMKHAPSGRACAG